MNKIEHQTFDEERALYHLQNTEVCDCTFAGAADGESVLKEARNICVSNCKFSLRYPLWHVQGFQLHGSTMDEDTRAALWYSHHGKIENCQLNGIKALRECSDIQISNSQIDSKEFGWRCDHVRICDADITSEYFLFESNHVDIQNLQMNGKYSFQYMQDVTIDHSNFDTKDAFWHSKHLTVKNTVLKGEYLGWFSENLTLINCKIIGTQPLCYCKNLVLIDCEMIDCDLSFEYSEVDASINGSILSVKNPKSGKIVADQIGEIVKEEPVIPCSCAIEIRIPAIG